MQFFEYYRRDSLLHKINPAVKLVLILVLMVVVTFVYDPYTPLIFSILALFQVTVLGKITFKQVAGMLLPLLLVLAGMTLTSIISFNTSVETNPEILFEVSGIEITVNSIKFGLTIGFRTFCFLMYSILFVATTDPTDFIISLIRQFKLSPRIGFGTLAGYRFVPLLGAEYQSIHEAHKIRGIREKKGALAKLKRFKKYVVPLMVTAARKAQRVAIAMDSKCFNAYPQRTYIRDLKIRKIDILYCIFFIILSIVIFILLANSGILNWGYRSLR